MALVCIEQALFGVAWVSPCPESRWPCLDLCRSNLVPGLLSCGLCVYSVRHDLRQGKYGSAPNLADSFSVVQSEELKYLTCEIVKEVSK